MAEALKALVRQANKQADVTPVDTYTAVGKYKVHIYSSTVYIIIVSLCVVVKRTLHFSLGAASQTTCLPQRIVLCQRQHHSSAHICT